MYWWHRKQYVDRLYRILKQLFMYCFKVFIAAKIFTSEHFFFLSSFFNEKRSLCRRKVSVLDVISNASFAGLTGKHFCYLILE
ncbi:MAG: hypothetical protein C9356_12200 [Oleiphilus sp.]|nr:MAG: hypothetical protein C9356_12200 [Oleiphilus sp.]